MTNPAPAPSGGGMPKWLVLLIVLILVIVLGCCGGIATCFWWVRVKAPGYVKEKMREQGIELNLPDATGNAAMPSNFPSDIPVYPGAKTTISQANVKLNSGDVTFATQDAAADVKSYYDKQMNDQGWKEDDTSSTGTDTFTMQYSKDGSTASVHIRRSGTTTTIFIPFRKK